MIARLLRMARSARGLLALPARQQQAHEELKLLAGTQLARQLIARPGYASLLELEFRVFSQFGDDGIIQYLVHALALRHRTFVEFGVEDYNEATTRFLLQKDNWSGFVMDGSEENIARLRAAPFFWRHDLRAKAAFITRENIGELLEDGTRGWAGVDLLHIDLDGNDYWIWKEIALRPAVVVVEYNSTFGIERALTIPYAPDFARIRAHFSHLYWGCSLRALDLLARSKGYAFVGSNSAGNNAYFVREELLNDRVKKAALEEGYVRAPYRESRDAAGRLSFLDFDERVAALRGQPVFDLEQDRVVPF